MNPLRKAALALACIGVIIAALSQIPGIELRYTHLFSPASVARPPHADIIFGGDMMFDRSVRTYAARYGGDYLFACLDPLFSKADLVVANLEGPITANPSISLNSAPGDGNNYTFTFPTTTASLLMRHDIGIVNLGNNHILNFGTIGVRSTLSELARAGVASFGDPQTHATAPYSHDDISLTFVGFNQFDPAGWRDAASTTLFEIRAAVASGELPIVYTHWGEEYAPATSLERSLAHAFVDAGAELVIGSHPHVVQEHEVYRGKHIYYSLGNLIFDQYWNDPVSHGLLVEVSFDAEGVSGVNEIPVVLQRNRQTCPVSEIEI